VAATDYCLTATIGGWTAAKHGPAGAIKVGKTFTASSCDVS
jgi:hypothetical protein